MNPSPALPAPLTVETGQVWKCSDGPMCLFDVLWVGGSYCLILRRGSPVPRMSPINALLQRRSIWRLVTPAPTRWKGAVCQSCETEFQCPKCGKQGPGEGTEDREP